MNRATGAAIDNLDNSGAAAPANHANLLATNRVGVVDDVRHCGDHLAIIVGAATGP
jgi:hypothetical protein